MSQSIKTILENLTFVVAVSDDTVLSANLLRSPIFDMAGRYEIIQQRGYTSASLAYNDAIVKASGRYFVFAHQDVYLPSGWDTRLALIPSNKNHNWCSAPKRP